MKFSFCVNKYLLMWYMLYQSSISEDVHKLKQKLWNNHKKEYSKLYTEKDAIIEDLDDYIPNDDLIYSVVEDSEIYKKIKTETNRYRLSLLEVWDLNRKTYLKELESILKIDLRDDYKIMVIHPSMNIIDINKDNNMIIVGKKIVTRDKDNFLTYLFYKIIKKMFLKLRYEDRDIIDTIIELITINELYTRMINETRYNYGKKDYFELKQQVYPYWLMYLGVKEDKFGEYMIRDNIFFNVGEYEYNSNLKEMDIYDFVGFIMKNKRKIFKKKIVNIDELEII
ncbi:MAG TPA: hypothetical protein PLT65_05115 [Bacilli bacterium]|nr:hypothetical protein [Bacilli bacterium]